MLRSERNYDRVIGGRGLQLEVERAAKTFSQRESPRAIDSIAEWRMQDELHSARLVKETFHHQSLLRRNRAERAISVSKVIGDLLGRASGERRLPACSFRQLAGNTEVLLPGT